MRPLTHGELCDLCISHAAQRGAVFISSETGDREKPDVFALFKDGETVVYECKASRADFRADMNKPFRKNMETGIGSQRIYVVNKGVCKPSEIPPGWRLAVAEDLNVLRMVIPCEPVCLRDRTRLHTFVCDDRKALALIASSLASGKPPLPRDTFEVQIGVTEPSKDVSDRLKEEGRCFVCMNRCRKDPSESYGCMDFFPDYGKILE